jgi:hypothetical protein
MYKISLKCKCLKSSHVKIVAILQKAQSRNLSGFEKGGKRARTRPRIPLRFFRLMLASSPLSCTSLASGYSKSRRSRFSLSRGRALNEKEKRSTSHRQYLASSMILTCALALRFISYSCYALLERVSLSLSLSLSLCVRGGNTGDSASLEYRADMYIIDTRFPSLGARSECQGREYEVSIGTFAALFI